MRKAKFSHAKNSAVIPAHFLLGERVKNEVNNGNRRGIDSCMVLAWAQWYKAFQTFTHAKESP